jgi:hypothetical protein
MYALEFSILRDLLQYSVCRYSIYPVRSQLGILADQQNSFPTLELNTIHKTHVPASQKHKQFKQWR